MADSGRYGADLLESSAPSSGKRAEIQARYRQRQKVGTPALWRMTCVLATPASTAVSTAAQDVDHVSGMLVTA